MSDDTIPSVPTIAIELTDLIQQAVSKYAVAYSHVTLTDMSTAMATWSVHETGHGDPFVHGVWEGQFDNKHDANQLAAKLRKEAAETAVAKWLERYQIIPNEIAAQIGKMARTGYDMTAMFERCEVPQETWDSVERTIGELENR